MSEEIRLHAVVRGRVQGVGFRHFVHRAATALELHGEVRNRPDGSVEVWAWGPRPGLDRLILQLHVGPSGARVSDVDTDFDLAPAAHRGFWISG